MRALRTVYHWIETGQLERDLDDATVHYTPRRVVSRRLDTYRGIIQARLQTYPLLTAQRVLEEIRAAGYSGIGVRTGHQILTTQAE